jgi:hypothetical protein
MYVMFCSDGGFTSLHLVEPLLLVGVEVWCWQYIFFHKFCGNCNSTNSYPCVNSMYTNDINSDSDLCIIILIFTFTLSVRNITKSGTSGPSTLKQSWKRCLLVWDYLRICWYCTAKATFACRTWEKKRTVLGLVGWDGGGGGGDYW